METESLDQVIFAALRNRLSCESFGQVRPITGGCINQGFSCETDRGTFFIKVNKDLGVSVFASEVRGLESLIQAGTLRVPEPFYCAQMSKGGSFLIMEYIPFGPEKAKTQELLGRGLALMHQNFTHENFGYEEDNTLGSTPQMNAWTADWLTFFTEKRLRFQLNLLEETLPDAILHRYGQDILLRTPRYFEGLDIVPSLLHGDLWSGNMAVDAEGNPVIFDPAVYYGHAEADLSVAGMFGGFSDSFYGAYHEIMPKADGFEERQSLYQLYHYLNHLNLFGSNYYHNCLALMKRLL